MRHVILWMKDCGIPSIGRCTQGLLPINRRAIAAIRDEEVKGEAREYACQKFIQDRDFARALEECELIPLSKSIVNNYRMFAAMELVSAAIKQGCLAEANRALDFFEPRLEVDAYWEFSRSRRGDCDGRRRANSAWVTEVANSNSAISTRLAIGLALKDEALGRHAEAVKRLVSVKPPADRPHVMVELAEGFAKLGDFDGANNLLRQLPAGSNDLNRGWAVIGKVAAQERDIAKAFEYLAILVRGNDKGQHGNIIVALANAGEVDAALDALSLSSPQEPLWPMISWTLWPIVTKRHDTAGVIACINAAPNGMKRIFLLTHAIGLEKHLTVPKGHFAERAERCVLSLTSELDRLKCSISIADGHLENSDRISAANAARRALTAYERIVLNGPDETRSKRDLALRFSLLDCLISCRLIPEASRLSREFPEEERNDARQRVAIATDDRELIEETILKLPINERDDAVETCVDEVCKRGQWATAHALTRLVSDPILRARCLISIVRAMGESPSSSVP